MDQTDAFDEITGKAEALGQMVAAHPACVALKSALEKFRGDEAAQKLEADYAAAARLLEEKGQAGEALEPEDKRREAELRDQMVGNVVIRDFLAAQAEFHELMQKANATLESAIGLE